jgi:hypothetical protein
MQITNTILMIRPLHFCKNAETAENNYFQQDEDNKPQNEILAAAQQEFDLFAEKLRSVGVNVIVVEDRKDVVTPDSIFPNNWISFHSNGDVAIYPMYAKNRRLERREDVMEILEDKGFQIERVIDLSDAEGENKYLEGTGSMVLDRENGVAYCALSERSDLELLEEFCEIFGFKAVSFSAFQSVQKKRLPIYHTNVVLTIGESFAVLCADCIDDESEREKVIRSLKRSEKEIILISEEQLANFAGNMLQVQTKKDDRILVMSQTAFNCLTQEQISQLEKHTGLLTVEIPTIEKLGGGSARCMLAEVFLPSNEN